VLSEQGSFVLDGSAVFDVKSEAMGDTLRITVVPPLLYDVFQQKLPAVFVLDGNGCLPIASSIARTLQMLAFGSIPPVICVGIGYPTDNLIDVMSLRTRDLTPTVATLPPSPMPIDAHGMGGAPQFLDALIEDVIPLVEERYRVDPADRCLVGWSLGGLFGLHAMFNRPETFARYVLISPSIWWDDRVVLRDEQAYAESHDDLAAKVFACVGEREEAAPSRMWPRVPDEYTAAAMDARMVSSLDELVTTLRSRRYPSLELTHHVFEDEHHVTVFPAAFTRGLTALYAG
jgi:predicted alpha/beta superfamily hydrolase